jgi:RNA polymerase sigma factor (sigma-70 family)
LRSDGELLTDYARLGSEDAFAELVKRHGPMVEAVCRRRLGSDAEDAFQAVFVLLARKAGGLASRREIGPWLHRTCGFVVRATVRERTRRRAHEEEAAAVKDASTPRTQQSPLEQGEVAGHLDDAVASLPERLRCVVVLCYLQGATQDEAARRLHLPLGTVAWRCSRGLEKLRARLEKRGVALGAAALGSLLLEGAATAAQSFTLLPSALAAPQIAAASATAGSACSSVLIAEGAIKMIFWAKMTKLSAAVAVAAIVIGCAGAPVVMSSMRAPEPPKMQIKDMWVVEAPPLEIPVETGKPLPAKAKETSKNADIVLRLRCTAVKPIGKRKKYTLDIVKVLKGENFSDPIEITMPGRKPGTLDFAISTFERGSVKLNPRMKELLAEANPGFEFDVAIDISNSVTFDRPLDISHESTSTLRFGYCALKRGGKLESLHRFPLGKWFTVPGSGARCKLPEKRPDPFARENIEQLPPEVMKKLRRQETACLAKGHALDSAYAKYARNRGTQALREAATAVAVINPASKALSEAIEKALQQAMGASYSRPVSVGWMIRSKDGMQEEKTFSVDGINRPLREYVARVGKKSLAVHDRLADLRVTAKTTQLTPAKLAALLAAKVGGRALKRGKVWHIIPRDEAPKQQF